MAGHRPGGCHFPRGELRHFSTLQCSISCCWTWTGAGAAEQRLVREWTMAVEECFFLYFPAAAALCRLCSSQQRVNAAAQKSSIGRALTFSDIFKPRNALPLKLKFIYLSLRSTRRQPLEKVHLPPLPSSFSPPCNMQSCTTCC